MLRAVCVCLFAVLLAGCAAGTGSSAGASSAAAAAPPGHELVWAREFETDGRPDPGTWGFEEGFSRNEELQWYQRGQRFVRDGMLVIEGSAGAVRTRGTRRARAIGRPAAGSRSTPRRR
jgi:hypothetical protein